MTSFKVLLFHCPVWAVFVFFVCVFCFTKCPWLSLMTKLAAPNCIFLAESSYTYCILAINFSRFMPGSHHNFYVCQMPVVLCGYCSHQVLHHSLQYLKNNFYTILHYLYFRWLYRAIDLFFVSCMNKRVLCICIQNCDRFIIIHYNDCGLLCCNDVVHILFAC